MPGSANVHKPNYPFGATEKMHENNRKTLYTMQLATLGYVTDM